MKIYVLSHTDPDGFFSAALVELHWRRVCDNLCITHKSWTYGRKEPNIKGFSEKYDFVYIVDLLPSNSFMDALIEEMGTNRIIWCDHHAGPDNAYMNHLINDLHIQPCMISGLRTTEKESAAMLVWKFYFSGTVIPHWLQLLSDYDSWNASVDESYWNEQVVPYMSYLNTYVTSVEQANRYLCTITDDISKYTFNDVMVDAHIKYGNMISSWQIALYNREVHHGFSAVLKCYPSDDCTSVREFKAWVVNTQNRGSRMFSTLLDIDDYDVCIPYNFNGKVYQYSMYTFKPDISCNGLVVMLPKPDTDGAETITFKGHRDAAGSTSTVCLFGQ